jgi:hypothetical protein
MTSRIFFTSKQRVLRHAGEVLNDLKIGHVQLDSDQNRIVACKKWNLLKRSKEIEILLYSDENRVEVAVNVEAWAKFFDFGAAEYLEEEILLRLKEKLN